MPDTDLDDGVTLVRNGEQYLNAVIGTKSWQFGNMWLFSQDEHENLLKLQKLVSEYLLGGAQKKPLCICIFGPPGSGKSFAVTQVYEKILASLAQHCDELSTKENKTQREIELEATVGKLELIKETFNLTQALSPSELISQIHQFFKNNKYDTAKEADDESKELVPFLFFDEFDAPLDGAPLGWLSWFLAPMQDGEIGSGQSRIKSKKAIYIFAGGTAETFIEFSGNKSAEFKKSKGPDFVSRLHSFIDVKGINFPSNRSLRRAFMLHNILQRHDGEDVNLPDDLTKKILRQGRFKHGARSIETILDVAIRDYKSGGDLNGSLEQKHFSASEVQSIHMDHGPLDSSKLNGLIGLSVGKGLQTNDSDGQDFVLELVKELWSLGATIGYGGKWDTNLTQDIVGESNNVLLSVTKQDKVNVFLRGDREHSDTNSDGIEWVSAKSYLKLSPVIPDDSFLEKALAGFRMRWIMSTRCSSRILIEGKLKEYSGRMPGVLEEAVMALSLGQPVFIVGKYGGASRVVGQQMGLSDASKHSETEELSFVEEKMEMINSYKDFFTPTGLDKLPLSTTESLAYIGNFTIGGPNWVPNGLSAKENRELFNCDCDSRIIQLITQGLKIIHN